MACQIFGVNRLVTSLFAFAPTFVALIDATPELSGIGLPQHRHFNAAVAGIRISGLERHAVHHADAQTISIDRVTASALEGWRRVQDRERAFLGTDSHPGDYVFTFKDGRPPPPDTIRQRFDRLAAAARLSRITFHDLRHSYATGALKAGVSPKVISERIGHANVGFFLQTYAHVLGRDDRDAAEQAAAFLIGGPWDVSNDKSG